MPSAHSEWVRRAHPRTDQRQLRILNIELIDVHANGRNLHSLRERPEDVIPQPDNVPLRIRTGFAAEPDPCMVQADPFCVARISLNGGMIPISLRALFEIRTFQDGKRQLSGVSENHWRCKAYKTDLVFVNTIVNETDFSLLAILRMPSPVSKRRRRVSIAKFLFAIRIVGIMNLVGGGWSSVAEQSDFATRSASSRSYGTCRRDVDKDRCFPRRSAMVRRSEIAISVNVLRLRVLKVTASAKMYRVNRVPSSVREDTERSR